jgi:hypothetical protein
MRILLLVCFFVFVVCERTKNPSFNFAASEAGAKIREKAPAFKKVQSILSEDRDNYMLFPCAQPSKYFVVELSEEILMMKFSLLNFEFYSSFIKSFLVYGSTKIEDSPQWVQYGNYTTKESRNENIFFLSKPAITRYLKFVILDHWGDERYCTLSILRVFGLTLLEDLKEAQVTKPTQSSISNPKSKNTFFKFLKPNPKQPGNILKLLLWKIKNQEKQSKMFKMTLNKYRMTFQRKIHNMELKYYKKFQRELNIFNQTIHHMSEKTKNVIIQFKKEIFIYIVIGLLILLIVQITLYLRDFRKIYRDVLYHIIGKK